MTEAHSVTLPYPDRQEITVGKCVCGWHIGYAWGYQRNAAWDADEHIRATTRTDPVWLDSSEGTVRVRPGRSL